MNKRKLLLLGNGGHCRSVLDTVLSLNCFDEIGIVEKSSDTDKERLVVGTDDDLPALFESGWNEAFITVGSVGDTHIRARLFNHVKGLGFTLPAIIDPRAVVSSNTEIGEGVFVGKKSVVNAGARIGRLSIINSGAIIEHDCHIGDFVHVSPGSVLCGEVGVGNYTHIGAGSVVIQNISIGERVLVGAGSVVVKDIPDGVKAFGNPCRIIK